MQLEISRLRAALQAAKIPHLVVGGDCWFSCPASGECCNDNLDGKCDCGADKHNAAIDAALGPAPETNARIPPREFDIESHTGLYTEGAEET